VTPRRGRSRVDAPSSERSVAVVTNRLPGALVRPVARLASPTSVGVERVKGRLFVGEETVLRVMG
jgi:hypothetical protein